jgi:6-pyruvoyltetrahydropterin/6-carboxytetrahydropterin synthase
MFTIEKDFTFEAAHWLPHHLGKCSRLHGHSFKATVSISSQSLQPEFQSDCGMVKDFADLKKIMEPLIKSNLDHHCLNDFIQNPTAENIAYFIFCHVSKHIENMDAISVTVHETCTARATYLHKFDY